MITTLDPLHSSQSVEWYTPPEIIDLVRRFYGGVIDLDPASCELANETVRAQRFYGLDNGEDGLRLAWDGRVFCNPPYGRKGLNAGVGAWVEKAILESRREPQGTMGSRMGSQIILLVNASTGEQWFQPLWDYPICFVRGRIKFINGEGTRQDSPTKSNALVCLSESTRCPSGDTMRRFMATTRFKSAFGKIGAVYVPEPFDFA